MSKQTSNKMKVAHSKLFRPAQEKPTRFSAKTHEFVHTHPRFLKIQERQACYVIDSSEKKEIPDLDEANLDPEDPTGLYLKDTKGFIKLRNAQANFMQRRQEANAAMHHEMGHKDEGDGVSLLMTKFQAGSICKSWYDGIRDLDPADHIGNDLNIKLLSVLQSVDTRPYYRRMVDDGTGKMKVHYESETE